MSRLILFGAGAAGRYALRHLREQGIEPLFFADNDVDKQGSSIDGLTVYSPTAALNKAPDGVWVACGISRPAGPELRAQIEELNVPFKPLWECLPVCHGLPSDKVREVLALIAGDIKTTLLVNDQCIFRRNPDYDRQLNPSPSSEIYFPDFIGKVANEVFVDCGAADGDTVREFTSRWTGFKAIVAFEPDQANYSKLSRQGDPGRKGRVTSLRMAVSDFDGQASFSANGDWSSHLGGDSTVRVVKLDRMMGDMVPTYIKMDIEGAELEAIWGAREILKKHRPVLAICAYHKSEHLWEIPLLIHAIQPNYQLFFRRYAEGAFEIVWYAVPPERIL